MERLFDPLAVMQALQNGDDVSWQAHETSEAIWMHWDPDRHQLVTSTESPREITLTLGQLWSGVWHRREAWMP